MELIFLSSLKKVKARRFYGSTTLAKARWGDAGWLIQSLCSPLWCICQEGSCTTNCQKIELIKTWRWVLFWLLFNFLFSQSFQAVQPLSLNLTKCNFFFLVRLNFRGFCYDYSWHFWLCVQFWSEWREVLLAGIKRPTFSRRAPVPASAPFFGSAATLEIVDAAFKMKVTEEVTKW